MQLVEKLGSTPHKSHKGRVVESIAQAEARRRKDQEKEDEGQDGTSGKSGTKTLATQNFNNKRNALYNYIGGKDDVVTLREWICARYNDKKDFAAKHYVSIVDLFHWSLSCKKGKL